MNPAFNFIASGLIALVVLIGGIFTGEYLAPKASAPTFGSTVFTPVGASQTTLSGSGVIATATTIPLTSFKTPDGRALVMSMFGNIGYGVLDPNSPSQIEDVTFTGITQNANGTAVLTGVSRGMDFVSPYLASSSLAKAHAGGSYFILSNTAGFYGQQFLFANQIGTSTATLVFSSTTPPHYDEPGAQASGNYISTTSEFASVAYVQAVAVSGAPNATTLAKGLVQLGTALQVASSTSLGGTGAALVLASVNSTDTPQIGCAVGYTAKAGAGCNIIADLTGHLKQAWIDLTANFTVTGMWNFSNGGFQVTGTASTTVASTSVTTANINTLNVNTLNQFGGSPGKFYLNTSPGIVAPGTNGSTTIFSVNIPANTLGTNNFITFTIPAWAFGAGNNSYIGFEVGYGNGTTTYIYTTPGTAIQNTLGNYGANVQIILAANGSTGSQLLYFGGNFSQSIVASSTIATSTTISQDSTAAHQLVFVAKGVGSSVVFFEPIMVTGVLSK